MKQLQGLVAQQDGLIAQQSARLQQLEQALQLPAPNAPQQPLAIGLPGHGDAAGALQPRLTWPSCLFLSIMRAASNGLTCWDSSKRRSPIGWTYVACGPGQSTPFRSSPLKRSAPGPSPNEPEPSAKRSRWSMFPSIARLEAILLMLCIVVYFYDSHESPFWLEAGVH